MEGPSWMLVLLLCAWTVAGLLPLQREQLDGKYEIGTIQNLFFFKDRIFFLADSDLFGFLDQKDGQLTSVYELELDLEERLLSASAHTVTIVREKKVNVFWPATADYVRSYETNFLEYHPDFSKIVAILRTMEGSLVLTDKFLMLVPPVPKGSKLNDVKQKLLVELTDPTEVFYTLVEVYNRKERRLDAYLASLLQNDKVSQVCFRKTRDEKPSRKCINLKAGDIVEDIVASGGTIYVQLTGGVLVFDGNAELVERLESEVQQYFAGLVTIGDDHQFYSPFTKSTHDLRIIDHTNTNRKGPLNLMGLVVEDDKFVLQNSTLDHKFNTILSFPRGPNDDPRKIWSYSQDNDTSFRLYMEFDDGRLRCSTVDTQKKTVEKVWEIITIQSVKIAKGELEAKDLQEEDDDEEVKEEDKESLEAKEPKEPKESVDDIGESLPPKHP